MRGLNAKVRNRSTDFDLHVSRTRLLSRSLHATADWHSVLASYVFYTATGEEFDERAIKRKTNFIGESARYDVYLLYEPDMNYLKSTALTLDMAGSLPKGSGKRRLIFAPTKYMDIIQLEENRIDFCQLPFEIYKAVKPKTA